MKKNLLAVILIAMLTVASAAAAPGDALLFPPTDLLNPYGNIHVAAIGDTLYLYRETGLYQYKAGDAEPSLLIDFQSTAFDGTPVLPPEEQPIYLTEKQAAEYTSTYLSLLIGGDRLYAISDYYGNNEIYRELWALNADQTAFERLFRLPDEGVLVEDAGQKYLGSMCGACYADGMIYFVIEEYTPRGGLSRLRAIDITSEAIRDIHTSENADRIRSVAAYKPGQLLVGIGDYGMSGIGIFDIERKSYEEKLRLITEPDVDYTTYFGLSYAAGDDTVYYARSGLLMGSKGFETPASVAYLPLGESVDAGKTVMLPSGYYVQSYYDNGIAFINVDPQYKQSGSLNIGGLQWNETTRKFAAAHPGFPLVGSGTYAGTADEIADAVNSGNGADVSEGSLSYIDFDLLIKRGYVAELDADPAVMNIISRLYPNIQSEIMRDGKLYAFPFGAGGNVHGYDAGLFKKVGLTEADAPRTFMQWMDFIDRWNHEYADKFPDVSLFDTGEIKDLRRDLLYQIMEGQMLLCQSRGEPLTFDTPEMRALFARLDALDYSYYMTWEEASAKGIDSIENAEYVLLHEYIDLRPGNGRGWYQWRSGDDRSDVKSMPLSMSDDAPPLIGMRLDVLFLNPASSNKELANTFMPYFIENLEPVERIAMMPDVNEIVEDPYYEQSKAWNEIYKKQIENSIAATTDEGEKAQMNQFLVDNLKTMEELELSRYIVTESDIAEYRDLYPNVIIRKFNPLYGSGETYDELQTLIGRYIDRQIGGDQFIMEISQKLQMMAMEG